MRNLKSGYIFYTKQVEQIKSRLNYRPFEEAWLVGTTLNLLLMILYAAITITTLILQRQQLNSYTL